jgi:hypothetical protein
LNGYPGNFEQVDPRKIVIDWRYQRQPKNTLIQTIAQNPSWEAFGVPTCFRRANGMLYCADGQQRIAGVMKSEKPPKTVPVVVFDIQDVEEEAEVFVMINELRKSLQPIEKHRGKIVAGNPASVAIEEVVTKTGFTIDTNTGKGSAGGARTIQAVAGVYVIYDRIGEEGLQQTLTVIKDAWPDDPTALTTHILRGVAGLIEEQGENYNRAKLTAALKKTEPHLVLRKADELRLDYGGSKLTQVRRAFAVLPSNLRMPKGKVLSEKAA